MSLFGDEGRERRIVDGAMPGRGHYSDYVDDVKQLKREGRLDEAETLLLRLDAAARRESAGEGWGLPAPWYADQLAIIYRKQRRYRDEVAILEQYLASVSPSKRSGMTGMRTRLEKARRLATEASA